MQTVVAFKTNNKITFVSNGALSTDIYMIRNDVENIMVCSNGIVLVADGRLNEVNTLDEIADFVEEPLEELNKDYIIDHILPHIHTVLDGNNIIQFNSNGKLDIEFSVLVGFKDKLFYIDYMFNIYEVNDLFAIGACKNTLLVNLTYINDDKLMIERTLKAMNDLKGICYMFQDQVLIIDTETLKCQNRRISLCQ